MEICVLVKNFTLTKNDLMPEEKKKDMEKMKDEKYLESQNEDQKKELEPEKDLTMHLKMQGRIAKINSKLYVYFVVSLAVLAENNKKTNNIMYRVQRIIFNKNTLIPEEGKKDVEKIKKENDLESLNEEQKMDLELEEILTKHLKMQGKSVKIIITDQVF